MGEKPEKERKGETQDETSGDWDVNRGVFAAIGDVAGEPAEAEREPGAKVEECTENKEKAAKDQQNASKFAHRAHGGKFMGRSGKESKRLER
jgi:hypothetical protein